MKNAGKACNNRLYRHIRTFEKIVKNYFVISAKPIDFYLQDCLCGSGGKTKASGLHKKENKR